MVATVEERVCELERAVGRHTPCPGDPCPFWVDSRCVVAGLRADLGESPDLAELLLTIRNQLGVAHDRALIPPGLRD
jgi:hypothetical protein